MKIVKQPYSFSIRTYLYEHQVYFEELKKTYWKLWTSRSALTAYPQQIRFDAKATNKSSFDGKKLNGGGKAFYFLVSFHNSFDAVKGTLDIRDRYGTSFTASNYGLCEKKVQQTGVCSA